MGEDEKKSSSEKSGANDDIEMTSQTGGSSKKKNGTTDSSNKTKPKKEETKKSNTGLYIAIFVVVLIVIIILVFVLSKKDDPVVINPCSLDLTMDAGCNPENLELFCTDGTLTDGTYTCKEMCNYHLLPTDGRKANTEYCGACEASALGNEYVGVCTFSSNPCFVNGMFHNTCDEDEFNEYCESQDIGDSMTPTNYCTDRCDAELDGTSTDPENGICAVCINLKPHNDNYRNSCPSVNHVCEVNGLDNCDVDDFEKYCVVPTTEYDDITCESVCDLKIMGEGHDCEYIGVCRDLVPGKYDMYCIPAEFDDCANNLGDKIECDAESFTSYCGTYTEDRNGTSCETVCDNHMDFANGGADPDCDFGEICHAIGGTKYSDLDICEVVNPCQEDLRDATICNTDNFIKYCDGTRTGYDKTDNQGNTCTSTCETRFEPSQPNGCDALEICKHLLDYYEDQCADVHELHRKQLSISTKYDNKTVYLFMPYSIDPSISRAVQYAADVSAITLTTDIRSDIGLDRGVWFVDDLYIHGFKNFMHSIACNNTNTTIVRSVVSTAMTGYTKFKIVKDGENNYKYYLRAIISEVPYFLIIENGVLTTTGDSGLATVWDLKRAYGSGDDMDIQLYSYPPPYNYTNPTVSAPLGNNIVTTRYLTAPTTGTGIIQAATTKPSSGSALDMTRIISNGRKQKTDSGNTVIAASVYITNSTTGLTTNTSTAVTTQTTLNRSSHVFYSLYGYLIHFNADHINHVMGMPQGFTSTNIVWGLASEIPDFPQDVNSGIGSGYRFTHINT